MSSRFAYKSVALGTALALTMSLVGSAFAEGPSTGSGSTAPTGAAVAVTTQSGSSTAIVVQGGSATSGAAVAGPGATAKTGNATASAAAGVEQNVYQDASTAATNGSAANSSQTANNTVNLAQSVTASTGTAIADGSKATATSGDAKATAKADVYQEVNQTADTSARTAFGNTATVAPTNGTVATTGVAQTVQSADNTDITFQTVLAQSGDAAALGGPQKAKATSGDVKAKAEVNQSQVIEQNYNDGETETIGGVAVVDQTAAQTINAVQVVVGASGTAEALVEATDESSDTDSTKGSSHGVREVSAQTGDVYATADAGQDQYISQEADAFAGLFEFGGSPVASIAQTASNVSIVNQYGLAFSGDAVATLAATTDGNSDDSSDVASFGSNRHQQIEAMSGDAWLFLNSCDDQAIEQYAEATAINDGIADVTQDATNDPILLQGSSSDPIFAGSGPAVADGTAQHGATAYSGYVSGWFWTWADQFTAQCTDTFAGSFSELQVPE